MSDTKIIFSTQLLKKHHATRARVMRTQTPHGEFLTPAFMPVGTRAFVNHMTPDDLEAAGSQIILGGNTYHMLCAPGLATIEKLGGMHHMMHWSHPMLTDSGGFQIFSLSQNKKVCQIDEAGGHFKHPLTGQLLHLTPELSIAAQRIIGADIIMAFDECTSEAGGREKALAALARTERWLLQSKAAHAKNPTSAYGLKQALFGIVQGGSFRDLRDRSLKFLLDLDLDGIGIGGEVIGFDMPKTVEIVDWLHDALPENKLRYTMGVGLGPQDLLDVIAAGADIFDCVAPTRNARHGALYAGKFVKENHWLKFVALEEPGLGADETRLLIKKSIYAHDQNPIMPGCACYTCRNFSRGYLHYLFKMKAGFYMQLASIHNIQVMQEACRKARDVVLGAG